MCTGTPASEEAVKLGLMRVEVLPDVQEEDTGICRRPRVLMCWGSEETYGDINPGTPKQGRG